MQPWMQPRQRGLKEMRFRWSRKNDHSKRRCLLILDIFTLLSVAKALRSGRWSNCKSRYHFRVLFALCAPFMERVVLRVRVSLFGAFCALSGGSICSISGFENKLYIFVRCIVFLVQIAYNDSASRKGMIPWLELQQTSASEWTAT